jgi:sugar phosphate isomerase/epimerase
MAYEFSLAHLTLLNLSPPDLIEVAARCGYDYVSLRPIAVTADEPKYPFGEDKELFAATRRKLADTGLKLLDIELVRVVEGIDARSCLPAFEAAAALGGKHVLSSVWTPDRDFAVDRFAEICALAKPFGLAVSLEFVSFADVSTLAQAAGIVAAAGADNAGICVDTLHFDRASTDLRELDNLAPSLFRFAQLCDAVKQHPASREEAIFTARSDRKFCGEGGLDVADIVNRLPQVPYSLEIPNAALALTMPPLAYARRCLDTAKAYLDAHPRTAGG